MIYSSPWTNLFLLMAIKMVLCGAVAGADVMANVTRIRRAPQPHHPHRVMTDEELDAPAAWKRSYWQKMHSILKHPESAKEEFECCPSVMEMVTKKGGKTPAGLYVELYEDGENSQRLYELSCLPEVVNKPCRFVDARLYNQSRCIQKYSYSYALVRYSAATEIPDERSRSKGHFSVPGSGGWSMDYVSVRAGCECQITPPKRKKKRHKKKNHGRPLQSGQYRRVDEEDDT